MICLLHTSRFRFNHLSYASQHISNKQLNIFPMKIERERHRIIYKTSWQRHKRTLNDDHEWDACRNYVKWTVFTDPKQEHEYKYSRFNIYIRLTGMKHTHFFVVQCAKPAHLSSAHCKCICLCVCVCINSRLWRPKTKSEQKKNNKINTQTHEAISNVQTHSSSVCVQSISSRFKPKEMWKYFTNEK